MLRRRMLIMLGIVLLIVLILGGYKGFSIYQQIQVFSAPKPAISVAVTDQLPHAGVDTAADLEYVRALLARQ